MNKKIIRNIGNELLKKVVTKLRKDKGNHYQVRIVKIENRVIFITNAILQISDDNRRVEISFLLNTPPSYIAFLSQAVMDLEFCTITDMPIYPVRENDGFEFITGNEAFKMFAKDILDDCEGCMVGKSVSNLLN